MERLDLVLAAVKCAASSPGSRVLVVVTDAGRFGVRQLKLAGADPGDVIMSLTAREARKILQRDSEKRWSISF